MVRWIAALIVIAACLAVASSQPRPAEQGPVLQVSKDGDETVWRVTRAGTVTLGEVLTHYTDYAGGTLAYNPQQIRGEVTLSPPREGSEYRGQQIDVLVLNLLEAFRFGIVENSTKILSVIQGSELAAHAPTVSPEELATLNPGRYYTCLVPLSHCDANSMTGMMRNLTTRQGGMVLPVQGANVVLICDRHERVTALVALAQEIDAKLKPIVRFYAVPEEVEPEDAVKLLTELIPSDARQDIRFATMPTRHGVIASAPEEIHSHIQAVVEAMKE